MKNKLYEVYDIVLITKGGEGISYPAGRWFVETFIYKPEAEAFLKRCIQNNLEKSIEYKLETWDEVKDNSKRAEIFKGVK